MRLEAARRRHAAGPGRSLAHEPCILRAGHIPLGVAAEWIRSADACAAGCVVTRGVRVRGVAVSADRSAAVSDAARVRERHATGVPVRGTAKRIDGADARAASGAVAAGRRAWGQARSRRRALPQGDRGAPQRKQCAHGAIGPTMRAGHAFQKVRNRAPRRDAFTAKQRICALCGRAMRPKTALKPMHAKAPGPCGPGA